MPAMTREELLWQKLVDETGEELIEQAAAVSVAQAERELAEAGFDVQAERARAEAFLASLEGTAASEPTAAQVAVQEALKESRQRVEKRAEAGRRKPRPVAVWLAAAAAVTAGAAVAYVETRPEEGPAPSPTTPPSTASPAPTPPDLVAAARDLGASRRGRCNSGRAEECLSLLDDAKKKDPAGEERDDVKALRQQAEDEMRTFEAPSKYETKPK